ncbi:MAG: endonuclease Q family protein, partial [Candidatus Woesearchaeota archaeon]
SSLTETDKDSGMFQTASGFKFVLQTEISLIYTQEKGRRVHNVVIAPSFQAVDEITTALLKRGRIDYDGRPIFKIPCPEFVEMMKSIDERIQVIPAHAWTPWFGVFGANGGFESLKECFQDQMKNIHAIETGISSDPSMNWRIKELDNINLVSFSDIHSFWPWRLGREATVFDIGPTFNALAKALETGSGLKETIEVNPNLGKYHMTGHRACNVCLKPNEAKKINNLCPECGKKLTVGVDQRIEELANRPLGYKPENAKPFKSLIPLSELLSVFNQKGVASKGIWGQYNNLVTGNCSEFDVLLTMPLSEIAEKTSKEFAAIVEKNRNGMITVKGGYDGVYGVPSLI